MNIIGNENRASARLFQVFVSSTYEDLKEERSQVIKALLEIDCMPVGMEYFSSSNENQWNVIKKLIDSSDYFVLITAGKYGSIADKSKKSYTELEYDYAIKQQIPTLAFLHHNIDEIPGKYLESSEVNKGKLKKFHAKLKKKLCRFYSTPFDLASALKSSLNRLRVASPRPGWVRAIDDFVGYYPIIFDLDNSDLPIHGLDGFGSSPNVLLGQGVTMAATVKSQSGDRAAMCAVATRWCTHSTYKAGIVRSGWFFHAWYPQGVPSFTFSPDWIYNQNMRHAAIFFKLHVMPDGSGYVHISCVSSEEYTLTLKTNEKLKKTGKFSWTDSSKINDGKTSTAVQNATWTFSTKIDKEKFDDNYFSYRNQNQK